MSDKPKLISQGAYGCVYFPGISCSGGPGDATRKGKEKNSHTKYITKLQKKNFTSQNEAAIGEMIQNIPYYNLYFAPIVKHCDIRLASIRADYVKDCDVISGSDSRADAQFEIQKIEHIDGMDLQDYLLQDGYDSGDIALTSTAQDAAEDATEDTEDADDANASNHHKSAAEPESVSFNMKRRVFSVLFDCYYYLLSGVELLIRNRVVHFDLKYNNVFVKRKTGTPIILDFGLSIDVDALLKVPFSEKGEKGGKGDGRNGTAATDDSNFLYRQYFYDYGPDYYVWPIEVHVINYLLHKAEVLDEEALNTLSHEYVYSNRGLVRFSDEFRSRFVHLCRKAYAPYIGKPRADVINELVKYWNTWDNYSLSIMFLGIFFKIVGFGGGDDGSNTSNSNDGSGAYFVRNELFIHFTQLLLLNVHPNPARRLDILTTIQEYTQMFYINESVASHKKIIQSLGNLKALRKRN